jgi:GntR family transcriptional regulator
MDLLRLEPGDHAPIYLQIARAIRGAIATGRLPPDGRLPTVRELATTLQVNPNTVAKVYSELARGGLLRTRRGVGTFVAAPTGDLTPPTGPEALRQFAARVLEDAAIVGFAGADVVAELQSQLAATTGQAG